MFILLFSTSDTSLNTNSSTDIEPTEINPASGLPMINGKEGVDVEGNPYGVDNSEIGINAPFSDASNSMLDSSGIFEVDCFSDGVSYSSSSIDDSFSSDSSDDW